MRKSTPRVKSGCRTCRIRRVKCDETKPSCLKCTQTGRKCDGYVEQNSADSSPPALTRRPSNSSSRLVAVAAYSIPFRVPGSQRDRQLLHYFCVQGARDLTGFVSNEFWSRTALLATQNEPIVRQSLIALSSRHLDLSRAGCPGIVAGNETLMRYGKALRSLQTRINRPCQTSEARFETTKTALICCILFCCFESSMGDSRAALSHLDNGLQLLAAHHQRQPEEDEEMVSLRDTLCRLDLQATFLDDGRTPTLRIVSPTEREGGLVYCPEDTFSELGDAQKQLIKLQNWLFHFLLENTPSQGQTKDCIPSVVLAEKDCLAAELHIWAQRCSNLTRRANDPDLSRAIRTLQVQQGVSQMLLDSKIPEQPRIFGDIPNLAAEKLVQLCESILQPDSHGVASAPATARFDASYRVLSSETGVVAALFLLAMKCADANVTDKAVELLGESRRREGLYDAVAMATLIRRLKGVKHRRQQDSKEVSLETGQEMSLEYWVGDLVDEAVPSVHGLEAVAGL